MVNSNEKLSDKVSEITMDPEKKKRVEQLFKSLRALDAAIEPFKEQRKDLRESFISNNWLTNDEFSLAKKAFNLWKTKTSLDDLGTFLDAGKAELPGV